MYYTIYFVIFYLVKLCTAAVTHNNVKTGFFWHVTDIHVDQNYSRFGNPNKLCHKGKALYPDNGLYGNFLCDSPGYLANITFQAMKKLKPNPDFIIWTGDNLPHTLTFDPEWNIIYEALRNVSDLLNENFPGIPVFPCIGNHDTFPPNMLLPNETSSSIYQDILEKGGWNKYLNKESSTTFIRGGFYSQIIEPGLRIISLNTILWYTPNYLTKKMIDPANQFEWLEDILNNCSKSSEKVYIIGHVPPGFYNRVKPGFKSSPTYHLQYLDAYLRILKKYSKVISGQMFGHLHMDMFQLFLLGTGHFVSSSILASSVTPWHTPDKSNVSIPVNPSIRLIHYDHTNSLLRDYDQYFLNLTKANSLNKIEESENLYELLYTFTKSYNVHDVSTESLVKVFETIKSNDILFEKFFTFSTAGKKSVVCDSSCKVAQLCSICSISIEDYDACMKNSSSDVSCHNNYILSANYSYYGIAIMVLVLLCISVLFAFFIKQKHRSHREIYSSY